jgi:hypothetical protein
MGGGELSDHTRGESLPWMNSRLAVLLEKRLELYGCYAFRRRIRRLA